MTGKKRESAQRERSKIWIAEALLGLMKDKAYHDITVTELAKRADLSRRTFYRHFRDVDEVMNYHFSRISDELLLLLAKELGAQKGFGAVVFVYFSFWARHGGFLKLLRENDLLHLIQKKFFPALRARLMTEDNYDLTRDYAFYFMLGGISSLLTKWIEDGAKQTPAQMGEIAANILAYMA